MAAKLTDPLNFLTNLVNKRGKSDRYGVYVTGANVIADAREDYGYGHDLGQAKEEVEHLWALEKADWSQLLMDARRDVDEIVHPISFIRNREPVTVFFTVEDHEMGAQVFIPTQVLDEFASEVTFFQVLLQEVAGFAGKTPTQLRFVIGAVSMEWDEMVEHGYAREVDIGF